MNAKNVQRVNIVLQLKQLFLWLLVFVDHFPVWGQQSCSDLNSCFGTCWTPLSLRLLVTRALCKIEFIPGNWLLVITAICFTSFGDNICSTNDTCHLSDWKNYSVICHVVPIPIWNHQHNALVIPVTQNLRCFWPSAH